MSEGKTFTEMLPEFAAEAERNPDSWGSAFEKSFGANRWHICEGMVFQGDYKYRRKPKTVKRTIDYPEPLREAPKSGTSVWLADPTFAGFCIWLRWVGFGGQLECFERGLLHATKEAAIAHGKALAGVTDE